MFADPAVPLRRTNERVDTQGVEHLTLAALSAPTSALLSDAAPFLIGLAGLLGLIIGSFLNVVIYRVPAGLSIVSPPSACPGCGTHIKARDNVPVLSWLLLRGRCRACKTSISVRYPLVEATTGVLFAATTWWSLVNAPALAPVLLYLTAVGVALFLIDLDCQRLPDSIVLPSYFVVSTGLLVAGMLGDNWTFTQTGLAALAFSLVFAAPYYVMQKEDLRLGGEDWAPLLGVTVGVVGWGVALWAAGTLVGEWPIQQMLLSALVWWLAFALPYGFTKGRGMGLGDVKLAPLLGVVLGVLGWGASLVGLLSGFVLGTVVGVVLMSFGKAGRKTKVPFGPFMLLGAVFGLVLGRPIFDVYLRLTGLA